MKCGASNPWPSPGMRKDPEAVALVGSSGCPDLLETDGSVREDWLNKTAGGFWLMISDGEKSENNKHG